MDNISLLEEKLKKCREAKIEDVNLDDLDELSEINISRKKSSNERILDYLKKTKNPYMFKMDGKIIKIEFSNNKRKAEDCITNVIKSIYK